MSKIQKEIYDDIVTRLKNIEIEHDITVLFAIESGSRAWGFESKDSDYDIRFVYMHKFEYYISILEKRDVIEYPIIDLIDINGWDIHKALQLFSKSNPTLSEWIKSPIIYLENSNFKNELLELENTAFSPKNSVFHYLNMAVTNYREYLKGDMVRIKKYFYVLRPIFSCLWIYKHNSPPPIEFDILLDDYTEIDYELKQEIHTLLERKMKGDELDLEPKIESINRFIDSKIEFTQNFSSHLDSVKINTNTLDDIFRKYVLGNR